MGRVCPPSCGLSPSLCSSLPGLSSQSLRRETGSLILLHVPPSPGLPEWTPLLSPRKLGLVLREGPLGWGPNRIGGDRGWGRASGFQVMEATESGHGRQPPAGDRTDVPQTGQAAANAWLGFSLRGKGERGETVGGGRPQALGHRWVTGHELPAPLPGAAAREASPSQTLGGDSGSRSRGLGLRSNAVHLGSRGDSPLRLPRGVGEMRSCTPGPRSQPEPGRERGGGSGPPETSGPGHPPVPFQERGVLMGGSFCGHVWVPGWTGDSGRPDRPVLTGCPASSEPTACIRSHTLELRGSALTPPNFQLPAGGGRATMWPQDPISFSGAPCTLASQA